jgi:FkbM family methyltransferase
VSLWTRVADKFIDAVELGPSFSLRFLSFAVGRRVHQADIHGFKVHLRRGSGDAVMFRRVFRNGDWDLKRSPQADRVQEAYDAILKRGERPVIIDGGANIGAAALWFARQFPQAEVVAIEPDPENARMCRLNTENVPNIRVVEAALGADSGTVTLTNEIGTADAVRTSRSTEGKVPIRTIAELTGEGRLFLVKVDIEGFESDLFTSNLEWLKQVSGVLIEPHDWMLPGRFSSLAFQRALSQHSFELLISGENLFYIR